MDLRTCTSDVGHRKCCMGPHWSYAGHGNWCTGLHISYLSDTRTKSLTFKGCKLFIEFFRAANVFAGNDV